MDDDASFTSMVTNAKDMDFKNLSQLVKEKQSSAFGVPLFMLGDPEHANKASSEVFRRSFWQDTLLPIMRKVTDKLNVHFTPTFGDDMIYLEFDLTKVEALADDRAEFAMSFFQVSQGLAQLNSIGPLAEGDMEDLLKDKFGIEVQGTYPDDPYEDEEEIMEEGARNPFVRQLKNLVLNYLNLSPEKRRNKSLKFMVLSYLQSPKRSRRPSAEQSEKLTDKIAKQVEALNFDPKQVAAYFDTLEKTARK